MVVFRFDSPMHTSYNEQKEDPPSAACLSSISILSRGLGTARCMKSLPARERLLGILAGTGRWYSNIMEGEQSNMKRCYVVSRPRTKLMDGYKKFLEAQGGRALRSNVVMGLLI